MPPHDFIWGHLKIMGEISNLLPKNVHLQYLTTTISKKYNMPPVFYLDLWPLGPNCMVVTDPDLAFQITANHEYQKHEEEKKAMDPLLGAGNIATAEGARWKHLHKQLSPAFSVSHVTSMRGMIAEEIMKFRGILHKLAESGEVFKLEDYGQRLIFDIIGKATFGESLKAQDNGSEALKYWEEITRTDMVVRQSWNPVKRYTLKKQIAAATTKLDALITSLVQRRFSMLKQDKPNGSSKRKQSIMELVLSEEILTGTHTLSTSFLSDAVSNVKTLLVAGTGTTADTLCFAFMLLSTRPDVVQRLRNEHDTVFTPGTNKTYTMLCDEPTKLNGLVYTTAVIKEVLRLYPIGSTVRRESPAGSVSHGGKTYSTKGQMIIPQALAMHLNPEFFANPTAFDPDRFVRDDFPRRAWRPFERGPRACLGQTLVRFFSFLWLVSSCRFSSWDGYF